MNDGWKARIGLLCTDDEHRDSEYWKCVPQGLGIMITRFAIPSYEVWDGAAASRAAEDPDIVASAKKLIIPQPRCIALACTAMSFARGVGYDAEISRRIENATGIPATTASTSVVNALRELRVGKVAVATPYCADLNKGLASFLAGNGLEVVAIRSVGDASTLENYDIPLDAVHQFVLESDDPSADAVFVSCTNFCPTELIEPLEQDLGKPVVTASQALMWESLRIAGVSSRLPNLGRLYTL